MTPSLSDTHLSRESIDVECDILMILLGNDTIFTYTRHKASYSEETTMEVKNVSLVRHIHSSLGN